MDDIVNLLHEIGMLANTPRSGFAFLGTGKQSVAEHSYRMAFIGYVLASMCKEPVDKHKLLLICLLHDLPEARTGDLNYMNKKYVKADEDKAIDDMRKGSPLASEFAGFIKEYSHGNSIEAKLAHDADQLELMLVLKQQQEIGNSRAMAWFDNACLRLITHEGKKLAQAIRSVPSDDWWMGDREDPHWINGGKQVKERSDP